MNVKITGTSLKSVNLYIYELWAIPLLQPLVQDAIINRKTRRQE